MIRKRISALVLTALFTFTLIPAVVYANQAPITVTIDGRQVNFQGQEPVIIDGRTLVPVRGVFEQMGFEVEWLADTRQAELTRGNDVVLITVGSDIFTLNSESHPLDVPAQIINDRTMLPLRLVLESLGYSLEWDEAENTVLIASAAELPQRDEAPLSGRQVISAPAGITMHISSYTASGLSFYFENLTDKEFTYGEDFVLYTFVSNAWEPVEPTIDSWGFFAIGHGIFPNSSTNERTVDWVWLFGELPSGDYRFQKDIIYSRQPGDFDIFVLQGDFTLP